MHHLEYYSSKNIATNHSYKHSYSILYQHLHSLNTALFTSIYRQSKFTSEVAVRWSSRKLVLICNATALYCPYREPIHTIRLLRPNQVVMIKFGTVGLWDWCRQVTYCILQYVTYSQGHGHRKNSIGPNGWPKSREPNVYIDIRICKSSLENPIFIWMDMPHLPRTYQTRIIA